ncbi:hypothetical protein EUV02_03920 [Polymorphobacter arshaanensis]|uniref:Terminase n=1 Tax=Glacieibacterium arshaanense TaxID=2511025 RepID=A0A4Y9ETC7_9SPHN|nr:hypothetical protein [Polymorphobacter arshaanensis]TFU06168.1 hypothetical protein EUV02_03920 [Polymorphobacter arshaanensis]
MAVAPLTADELAQKALEKKRKAARLRLLNDFEYYAPRILKIRTKTGETLPFKLNRAQRQFFEQILDQWQKTGRVRVVVLKARQMGLSTLWGAFMFWWTTQHKGQKAMVITHKTDSTKALFDMTKRFYDSIEPGHPCKPSSGASSVRELKFDILDSGYMVGTAGSDTVGRGETLQLVHASELGLWPKGKAADILNGLLQAVPKNDDTFVAIESTARGTSGPFYEYWQGARLDPLDPEGNGFIQVFLPWFIQDEYCEEPIEGFTRTLDEEELAEKHGLSDGQLMWRRRKVAADGLDLFKQEYPSNAMEAFLTSGRPVFNLEKLHERLAVCPNIIHRLGLQLGPKPEFMPDPRGELLVYREHNPAESYTIGSDVAEGIPGARKSNGEFEGDYTVAQVFDSRKRQVAVWRGHVDPDFWATTVYHLGLYYNDALLAVEVNNQGILPNTRLEKDFDYPNLYRRLQYDKMRDEEVAKVGFKTDQISKPLIISELRAAIRDGTIELNDQKTIQELMTFVVNPNTGGMEAEYGSHDDTVMALAITNHIHEGRFDPIEVPEDSYFGSI